jgi:hypothetical protein
VAIASHRIAVTAARSFLRRKTAKASEHGAAAGDGDGDFFTQRSRRRSNAQLLPVPASPSLFTYRLAVSQKSSESSSEGTPRLLVWSSGHGWPESEIIYHHPSTTLHCCSLFGWPVAGAGLF